MVITGVMRSKLPRMTQLAQSSMVKSVARWGSSLSGALKYFKTGRMSSFAMAARSRGAPVKFWSAAPRVDKITPTCTTHGTGHATVAVSNLIKYTRKQSHEFKRKAIPQPDLPCTSTLPLSSGILITEQHRPQSKRQNRKPVCYLSVKSSSRVATAANITAEIK